MQRFETVSAVAVPIAQPNVDTDQIIPARYLQKPRSVDFGPLLFRDLRFGAAGTERDFVLNRSPYRSARIMVAERNFGCGSSREQAVWALSDYGIRAVIAPSFGDIFRSNSLKNGLLPVTLAEDLVAQMLRALQTAPGTHMTIDLESQIVIAPDTTRHRFEIDPFPKRCLLEGLDELAYTLTLHDRIVAFEQEYGA